MPTLEITTKLGCSLACTFCPQGALAKNYPRGADRLLSFENFAGVLEKVPKHVRIDFSGMSEPWLNPDATRMVRHAYAAGRKVAIYTTLEGLKADDAKDLLERFADRIAPATPWVIHLPDDEKNMAGWKVSDSYLATLATFVHFKRRHPRSSLRFMTMSSSGRVAKEIQPVLRGRLKRFIGISRAENLRRNEFSSQALVKKIEHTSAVVCKSTPFFDHNCLLPNGDVVLCCMDYSLECVIGNLFSQSYEEIFRSKPIADVRLRAMTPCSDPSFICKRCDNASPIPIGSRDNEWRLAQPTYWARER